MRAILLWGGQFEAGPCSSDLCSISHISPKLPLLSHYLFLEKKARHRIGFLLLIFGIFFTGQTFAQEYKGKPGVNDEVSKESIQNKDLPPLSNDSPSRPESVNASSLYPSANDILAKVVTALKSTNYRGRITYEQNGKLELIEVSHAVIDGTEHEKITFLNGADRALTKQGKSVACRSAGDQLLSGSVVNLPGGGFAELQKSYQLAVIGQDRVAGREAWVVQMLPVDDFRYGLIFTVDKASYIPLKTMYVSDARKVLERLHFVSLETSVDFSIADFKGATDYGVSLCRTRSASVEPAAGAWLPSWVPPGFVLTAYSYSEEEGHVETYTDGLASFTLIIKVLDKSLATSPNLATNLRKGATIILLRQYSAENLPIQASLLGEIPIEVANQILASVKAPQR